MTIVDDAKKVYDDSVKLYKKSILLYRHSKKTHKHHSKSKSHHPSHCYNMFKSRKEYEDLVKSLSKRVKKLKHVVKK